MRSGVRFIRRNAAVDSAITSTPANPKNNEVSIRVPSVLKYSARISA